MLGEDGSWAATQRAAVERARAEVRRLRAEASERKAAPGPHALWFVPRALAFWRPDDGTKAAAVAAAEKATKVLTRSQSAATALAGDRRALALERTSEAQRKLDAAARQAAARSDAAAASRVRTRVKQSKDRARLMPAPSPAVIKSVEAAMASAEGGAATIATTPPELSPNFSHYAATDERAATRPKPKLPSEVAAEAVEAAEAAAAVETRGAREAADVEPATLEQYLAARGLGKYLDLIVEQGIGSAEEVVDTSLLPEEDLIDDIGMAPEDMAALYGPPLGEQPEPEYMNMGAPI
jgi:hypothetical protein